jgi:hypothetical protein
MIPLGFALDDEGVAADGELIARVGLATSLARSSNVAVSAWIRVSPKPTIVSGRRTMTRTLTRRPTGRCRWPDPKAAKVSSTAPANTVIRRGEP